MDVLHLFDIETGELKWHANTTSRLNDREVDVAISLTKDFVALVSYHNCHVSSLIAGPKNASDTVIRYFDQGTGKGNEMVRYQPGITCVFTSVISNLEANNVFIITKSTYVDFQDFAVMYQYDAGTLHKFQTGEFEFGFRVIQAQLLRGRILILTTMSTLEKGFFEMFAADATQGLESDKIRLLHRIPFGRSVPFLDRDISFLMPKSEFPVEASAILSNTAVGVKVCRSQLLKDVSDVLN